MWQRGMACTASINGGIAMACEERHHAYGALFPIMTFMAYQWRGAPLP